MPVNNIFDKVVNIVKSEFFKHIVDEVRRSCRRVDVKGNVVYGFDCASPTRENILDYGRFTVDVMVIRRDDRVEYRNFLIDEVHSVEVEKIDENSVLVKWVKQHV